MLTLLTMLALLMQPKAEEQKIFVDLEYAAGKTTHLYDPIFVRTSIRNESDQPIEYFTNIYYPTIYELSHQRFAYRYDIPNLVIRDSSRTSIAIDSQKSLVIDNRILEFPPPESLDHSFWENISHPQLIVSVIMVPQKYAPLFGPSSWHSNYARPKFKSRPDKEMAFLTELFSEVGKRNRAASRLNYRERFTKPSDYPLPPGEPNLSLFGISIYNKDLQDKLLAYEENLSPGTLRDVVFLTNQLQDMFREKDDEKQLEIVLSLTEWLDNLSEVQRSILILRILEWQIRRTHDTWPDEDKKDPAAFYHFLHECNLRHPIEKFRKHYQESSSLHKYPLALIPREYKAYRKLLQQREHKRQLQQQELQKLQEAKEQAEQKRQLLREKVQKLREEKKQPQPSPEGDPFQD